MTLIMLFTFSNVLHIPNIYDHLERKYLKKEFEKLLKKY